MMIPRSHYFLSEMTMDNDIEHDYFESVKKAREERIEAHEKVLASPAYQGEWRFFERMTFDFLQAIQACFLMSRRAPQIYDEMLVFRLTDDLIQSSLATYSLVASGIHNTVAREMRFMIESGVKQLYVDQQRPNESFTEKLRFLHEEVDSSAISMVEHLSLPGLEEASKKEFCDELRDVYYKQCAYIHPSRKQFEEMVARAKAGKPIGFESSTELRNISSLVFRVFDMLLAIHFHGLGLGLAGDVLVQCFDPDEKWKFHKGKYTKRLSSYFDYKAERSGRNRAN
jgi:hypothetical protein